MNVGIIGLGYVGLTLAVAAVSKGINVYGLEINDKIKKCLSRNKAHFFEPGLDSLIVRYNNKTLHVVDAFPKDVSFDAIIITVGTPLKQGSKKPNFSYIKSALSAIKNIYDGTQLIVLRSTVSVGTTRKIVLPFLAKMCHKRENECLVAMCPERTIEGKAIDELTNLPQIISGNNEKALGIAQRLFRKITPSIVEAKSIEEAELIKLYCNTYRDMTFAIGNAFCMAAQKFNVDGQSAILNANYGYPRSNISKPGFVAGPCLEKDAYLLINNMPNCDSKKFILSARRFNESMEDKVIQWVVSKIGTASKDNIIAISGMAFKGQPETSDLRGSTSVYIAKKLKNLGYTLKLHDFVASFDEMKDLQLGEVFTDLNELCKDAKLLLVLNNHKKYNSVMPVPSMKQNDFEVFDSWGVCTELQYSDQIKISTLGNMFNHKKKENK